MYSTYNQKLAPVTQHHTSTACPPHPLPPRSSGNILPKPTHAQTLGFQMSQREAMQFPYVKKTDPAWL